MPNTHRPKQASFNHGKQTQTAFKPSSLDIVIHEGTVISPDDKRINGAVVVRQGVIDIETDVNTPEGIKTVVLAHVEAGEYFFEHLLFGFKNESSLKLRYRAQKRSVVIVLTREMLLRDPAMTAEVCGNMLRTKNRETDRLRLCVYARQVGLEAEAVKMDSLALTALKNTSEELAQDLETANFENRALQSHVDRLNAELTRVKSALKEVSHENQELWRYIRTLEGKALVQEKHIASLKAKIAILECEDTKLAFRELTAEILKAQEATASAKQMEREAERRMNLIQRGLELLSMENPGIKMSATVMLLLLGEEPANLPPNKKFDARNDDMGPTPDELDRIFENMPINMQASSASSLPECHPQALSSKITVPPKVGKAPMLTVQLPPMRAPRPKAAAPTAPPQPSTHDSMPEITFTQEEADTDLREIMGDDEGHAKQATLLDPCEIEIVTSVAQPEPFRLETTASNLTEDEIRTTLIVSPPAQRRDETSDLNKTRAWMAVKIDPPPDDREYEVIDDKNLDPLAQNKRPFDISGFSNSDNKKNGQ